VPFTDRARIHVEGGRGGDGCLSFRREPHKPRGGPDGGNGGRGGHVLLVVDPTADDLSFFRSHVHFTAPSGGHGEGSRRDGRSGEDLSVPVPPDTRVIRDGDLIARLTEPGQTIQVAQGGTGGIGNRAFRSSTNRAPRTTTPGEAGEATWLRLEFRLPADVAIVGLPNSGKSALLGALTGAPAAVAAYPHSTREPELGTMTDDYGERRLVVDLPGVDDAGRPRRHAHLEQLEHARVILHCVDATDPREPAERIALVRQAIAEHRPDGTRELVVATGCPPEERPDWADWALELADGGRAPDLAATLMQSLERAA
jgi:GTP-binding protein